MSNNINSRKPTSIALTVMGELKASHGLQGFETPHFHIWKVAAQFNAALPLAGDRVIDLVFLQHSLEEILKPVSGQFLNQALPFSPTSENLALWIWDQLIEALPDASLHLVEITLCNLEGTPSGSAKVMK